MEKIVLRGQELYGKNSAKRAVGVLQKEQKEYGRNSAKGAVVVLQE